MREWVARVKRRQREDTAVWMMVARLESAGRSSRFALRQRAEAFTTDGRIDKF